MRSFMTAMALVMLATTPAAANDAVQDVRLRVQNLTRPDGKQSATFTGRTARVAQAQPVTVTLEIDGTTTVTLTGKISRSGRLRAVGRLLALATPLGSFTRIDVAVSGGLTTALDMLAGECVASARGRRLDCVEAGDSIGAFVDGVYDLAIDGRTPPGTREVASLHTFPDGRRQLTMYDDALNNASLAMTPDLELSGYYWLGGDFGQMVEGRGTDESTASRARMTGTLVSQTMPDLAFALERDVAGTPSSLGGAWTFTFTGFGLEPWNGVGALTLAVPASGRATTAATTITGSRTYAVAASTCDVAPAGGIHCRLFTTESGRQDVLQIHGYLDETTGAGQGTFAEGFAPQIRSEGTWTARRGAPPDTVTDGAYDLTIAGRTPSGTTASASLSTNPDGTRRLRLWDSALDYATLTMATDGALTGSFVFGGDAFVSVVGGATDHSTIVVSQLTGSYSGPILGTHSFTMERVVAGTPSTFGGTWNVSLGGGGLAGVLDLVVPANGDATAAATTFGGSSPIYTTRAGMCTIAPAGGTHCVLPLAFPPGNEAVYLHGTFDPDLGAGHGTFAVGAAPVIRNQGTWTATR